jgi:hypothetical protein
LQKKNWQKANEKSRSRQNPGDSVGLLAAISENGIIAALKVRGATDETVMLAFIEEILSRVLSPSGLSKAISKALKTITAADTRNWIRHCSYV